MDYFAGEQTRATDRLDEFIDPSLRRKREDAKKKKNSISKVLERTTALAAPLQPKPPKKTSQLKSKNSRWPDFDPKTPLLCF